VPSYAARRTLPATREDVWRFLAEPENLPDWWPGIVAVRADRQGFVPGARWDLVGPSRPGYMRRPQAEGKLLVLEVEPLERLSFRVTSDRIDADLRILAVDADRTDVELTVEGPWLIGLSRRFPQQALHRLSSRVAPAAPD
jgi:uncharacterized protein YndB with AHSA1/START domain